MKHVFLAGVAACLPLIAFPQSPDASEDAPEGQTFVPADFARFAPRTALDMVSQIPGFNISGGGNQRGFGQAQENVLINGRRISSKSTSATDVLSQLSADNVIQIEVLDGAALDIPGLTGQVANVSTTSTGISGTWGYRQRYREDLRPVFDWFDVSINGTQGGVKWRASLESSPGRGANAGRENITDGQGNLLEYREEDFTNHQTRIVGELGLVWESDDGRVASLNGSYGIRQNDGQEFSNRFAPDGTELSRAIFTDAEDEWESEISGDYAFDLGPGRLKLIGLQRNEHSPFVDQFRFQTSDGSLSEISIFEQTIDESESILRSEYSWQGANRTDWQVSLEGAFNSLESEAALFEGDFQTPPTAIPLRTPGVKVEETRAEAFLTYGRQLRSNLRLQTSLGAEVSEISSDGPNGQSRSFTRPKGSIALLWQARENLTINTELSREVGQLNFFDFVSSVDLNEGEDEVGNIEIVPDQTWRLETQFERDYGRYGAATLTLYGEQIDDIIDQVPIGRGEGPGNLDSAIRYGFDLEGTLQLAPLGIEGAQLEYQFDYRWSDVEDPLTGESRRINDDKIRYFQLDFRHDIPNTNWAYGSFIDLFFESPTFRLDSVRASENAQPFANLFIEHKDIYGLTGRIVLGNIFDQDDNFTRIRYAPDRTGEIARVEDRSRNFGPILTLRLSGSF